MFRIKICGVRSETDIDSVAEAGADAVGFNFHPPSIRYVDAPQAIRLSVRAAQRSLTRVGVFVEQSVDEISRIADSAQIDFVQLHGGQTIADALWLSDRGFRVIRVIRLAVGPLDPESISAAVASWGFGDFPLLFDAEAGAHGGGLGLRLDWEAIGKWSKIEMFSEKVPQTSGEAKAQWAIAGGLTPETIGEAIVNSRATAIDVASGVEEPRGEKCRHKIDLFVNAALAAWGLAESS